MSSEPKMRRALRAVMVADVVGYSKMMGADAAATVAVLRRIRRDILETAIASKGGQLVKSMGDGWIVLFSCAADAVECAMQVQDQLKSDGAVELRIGMHLGDVSELEEDVFGEGINVAARLQSIAEPGAFAVSGTVRDVLDGTLRPSFDGVGARTLKNIAEPVPVWVRGGDVAGGKEALNATGFPSIEILPVAASEAWHDLGLALTGEMATHLNAPRYLRAHVTSAPSGGTYCLRSSLQSGSNGLRLTATLVSPEGHDVKVWKIDGPSNAGFEWQDATGLHMAQQTLDAILSHTVLSYQDLPDTACSAPQLYLRSIVLGATDGQGMRVMMDLLATAIEADPDWGPAYAQAIGLAALAASNGTSAHIRDQLHKLPDWQTKLDALEPDFSPARIVLALGQIVRTGDAGVVRRQIRRVMRSLPFDPDALHWAAWAYNFTDTPGDALACLDMLERSIFPSHAAPSILNARAFAHFLQGEFEKCCDFTAKAADLAPEDVGAHLISASALALTDRSAEAAQALLRVQTLAPDYTLHSAGYRETVERSPGIARYYDGLRAAGLT